MLFLSGLYARKERLEAAAAETQVISKEQQMIYFSDGSSLKVDTLEDVIRITGTHVKSNNRYSYATAGFNITLEKTGGMVEQYDHLPVTMLRKEETIEEEVTTSYILDRNSIYDAVLELFRKQYAGLEEDKIQQKFLEQLHEEKGLDFYLHNIFQVIERTGGSGSQIISASKAYHNLGTAVGSSGKKVSGILNAIYELYGLEWSAATQAKLPEYYDIHMKIFMEPCYANIYLVSEEGEILGCIVDNYPLVQYAQMNYRLPENCYEELVVGERRYQLTEESIRKSYVCYGDSAQKAQTYSMNRSEGLLVRIGTGEVSYKQLLAEDSFVYLVCELLAVQEEAPEDVVQGREKEISIECFDPMAELELRAESWENPLFDVSSAGGIPVNEELCFKGKVSGYLLKAKFMQQEGEVELWIPVKKTYDLHWWEITGYEEDEPVYETFSYQKTVQTYVAVQREYSYIEVKEIEYYQLDSVCVKNGALPQGAVCLKKEEIRFEAALPALSYQSYGTLSEHIIYPSESETGIVLPTQIIYGGDRMPAVPEEDFTSLVDEMVPELKVRSDSFCFGGEQYLNAAYCSQEERNTEQERAALFSLKQKQIAGEISKEKQRIPETVRNGIYQSQEEIVYRRKVSTSAAGSEKIVFQNTEINPVFVHTPVYCEGSFTTDNRKYCQMVTPAEEMEVLVLDEEGISSDFFVSISNYGYHSGKKGYGMRDYAYSLCAPELSYIASEGGRLRNEVYFPFDVFLDVGTDYNQENDLFYRAGQWIVIGEESVRFYLPEWVEEGQYEICYRTIAVNGTAYTERQEMNANTRYSNYVATDSRMVEVSGKIYGFQIYDIADYPAWQALFRNEAGEIDGIRYTAGSCDEYGRKVADTEQYTLPILSGSHPESVKEYIKPGYVFRFSINTIGKKMSADSSYIEIIPRFYHVDESGNERKEVDLYYCKREEDGKKYLVKIGSKQDMVYQIMEETGSRWLGIPEEELVLTAQIRGEVIETYRKKRDVLYTYALLRGKTAFRTFCNFSYAEQMSRHAQWEKLYARGMRLEQLYSLKQRHYFSYSLPYDVKAVAAGYPVESYASEKGVNFSEEFWIKDGYLIVSFEIIAYADGRAYLDYANVENQKKGYCSMWSKEKKPSEKTDGSGKLFYFEQEDIFCFPVNSSIQQDYLQGGIY